MRMMAETPVHKDGPVGTPGFQAARGRTPEPRSAPVENSPFEVQPQQQKEEPMLYCPVCNLRLAGRHCKLVCDRCGYYLSCSDYY